MRARACRHSDSTYRHSKPARHGLAARAGLLIASLEPALTAIMAIFLLGEWLDGWQWLGAGLILVAVVLAQTEAEHRISQPEPHVPAEAKG